MHQEIRQQHLHANHLPVFAPSVDGISTAELASPAILENAQVLDSHSPL